MAAINGIYLPLELWETIFIYLSSSDVINFCKASPEFMFFLKQRNVVKNFDVSGDYYFIDNNLQDFIKSNVSFEYIKALNINKLYWIPLEELRKLVKSLTNLEELYALNTKLSLRVKDVAVYSKLKTLAVTIEGTHFVQNADSTIYKNNLYLLRKLCIHFTRKHIKSNPIIHRLFGELFALKELWIYDLDDSDHALKYDIIVSQMKFLKKLVIKSRVNIPFLDYKPFGLAKYFETRRFKSIVMKYEHFKLDHIIPLKDVSIFQPFETDLEAAWDVLHTYRSEMPYDPDIHRQVYLTKQIKTAKFRELNFFHYKCFCTQDYVKATLDFLRSPNSQDLKKLSIKSCVLQRYPIPKGQHNLSNLTPKYPISEVIQNCQILTTLELMQCTRIENIKDIDGNLTCNISILDGYPLLCGWKNLERFTLEVPSHLNGMFLVDLIQTCTKLKYLRIISNNTNPKLNRYLYQGLKYASHLEDFCFENKYISLPTLFHSLQENKNFKLRRIHISCDDSGPPQVEPLEDFLLANPQLLFLSLIMHQKSGRYVNRWQNVLNKHKTKDSGKDSKFFFAKNCRLTNVSLVPEVHRELLNYDSEVSGVDFYDFR